ncbi:signal peptidase II [Magnetovibrio blakemorei]|uniref:Lipoprotein signal peptidase n=1 Tax=Magnetovibrio blakemorei TaxID=28181 RepID=A0A1E5Q872_9PROT|nr:signal peptidase II [Magnetovibrio blakemorei]OEJ67560.1 signal peptidase II [Magnetovibrio blakemorei]
MSGAKTPKGNGSAQGWGLAVLILIADQVSKWWVLGLFSDAGTSYFELTPFFNLVLAWNEGISFGMFGDAGVYGPRILIGLTLLIALGLSVWMMRVETRWSAASLGLIIGGAIGNVIDRFRFGAVTDFLDVHVLGYHWPAFNVADSAIVIGAGALMWESLFAGADNSSSKDVSDEHRKNAQGTDETHD